MSRMRTASYPGGATRLRGTFGALFGIALLITGLLPLSLVPTVSAATANIINLAFTTSPQTVTTNVVSAKITVQSRNIGNTSESTDTTGTSLTLTSSSPTGSFSRNGSANWSPTNSLTFTVNNGTANSNFHYRDSSPGTHSLTATLTTSTPASYSASQSITVTAPPLTVCASGCGYIDIKSAVAAAPAGSTITIKSGTYPVSSPINLDKQLTLTGQGVAEITTTGTGYVFLITAPGVTLSNLTFSKIDKHGPQNLVGIQSNEATVISNIFRGQYVLGDVDISRAVELVANATNVTISNNFFSGLRQPAYINNGTTGTIRDNRTSGTRGWMVEQASNIAFTGNTWDNNVTDIAIIAGPSPTATNTYTCERTHEMIANNNNAKIDNQITGICPPPATTDPPKGADSAPSSHAPHPVTPTLTSTPRVTRINTAAANGYLDRGATGMTMGDAATDSSLAEDVSKNDILGDEDERGISSTSTSRPDKTDKDAKNDKQDDTAAISTCTKILGLCWYAWLPLVFISGYIIYRYFRSNTEETTTSGE